MNRIDAPPHPTPRADVPAAPSAPDSASSDELYLPVLRLWMLRVLVHCNGARNFVGERRLREPAVARMLELKGLSPSRYSESAAMRALQRKLDEMERLAPTFPATPTLARNIQRMAQRLALNPVERDILHFTCAQHMQPQLCEVLGMVGDLTRASLCRLVADCLGHPVRDVQRALDDRGRLSRSALLTVDDRSSYTFERKIDLLPGLAESLLLEHDDLLDLFGQAVVKAPAPTLALADFGHLADDLRILRSYLDAVAAKGQPGVNVLLHGRPGTGKTELARAVAAEIGLVLMEVPTEEPSGKPRAGRERFESYRFAQCLLEGSPGHAVLFDEVEKAHPDVFNVLLQVLDDGRLTDGQGRTVDFKNTVIVMTSNLGSHLIMQMAGQPSEDIKDAVWAEVKQHFRPEFLNRIDETVVFHALDQAHIENIAKIQLKHLEQRLAKMEMKLEVSPAALAELAKAGFDPVFGARPLKRAIQHRIENPVSKLILQGRFGPKDVIPVDVEGGQFTFERTVH